jgi:hypothetical protein
MVASYYNYSYSIKYVANAPSALWVANALTISSSCDQPLQIAKEGEQVLDLGSRGESG